MTMLSGSFSARLEAFLRKRDAGHFQDAMEEAAAALRVSASRGERGEWYRMQSVLLVDFGRIAAGVEMARCALREISNCEVDDPLAPVDPRLVKLGILEVLALHVDPVEARSLAATARELAIHMLSDRRCSESKGTLWISLALMARVLEEPEESFEAYRRAVDETPPGPEQVMVWLDLASATSGIRGFQAAFEIVMEKVLPELQQYPELQSAAFSQVGDLFLGYEHWGVGRHRI